MGIHAGKRPNYNAGSIIKDYEIGSRRPQIICSFDNGFIILNNRKVSFESLLTHTRSGNAVQVADDGTLQWAGHNLLTYSEDFSNADWVKLDVTVTTNAATAPDGTLTADKIIPDNAAAIGPTSARLYNTYVNPAAPVLNNGAVWVKAGEFDTAIITIVGGAPAINAGVTIDLTNGSLSSATGTFTPTVIDEGDGWYKVTIGDTSNSTSATPGFNIYPDDSTASTGDGTSGIYVWGAHVYRSDLGGMADIPTSYRGLSSSSTYLPTTTAARYLPRVDNHIWDGSSWVKRCLVEPQSTNLVTYSEDFTDVSWSRLSGLAAMSSPTETGVDGNTSASLFSRANTSSTGLLYRVETITSGNTYTVSAYVKPDTHAFVAIALQGVGSEHFATAVFDIGSANTGASETDVGTTSGTIVNTNQEVASNGFYRISITCSVAQTTAYPWIGFATAATGNTFSNTGQVLGTWDLSDAFIGGGFQLEASSVPTSYIPTAGATVTRPADALSIDSTLLPYDSTAMTIAMEGEMTYADNNAGYEVIFVEWEKDLNNFILNRLRTNTGTGQIVFRQDESGVSDERASTGSIYSPGVNVPFNIASRHTSSDLNGAVDGTALTANITPTALPDLSATDLQIAPTDVVNIKSLRILGGYGATDAELEAATS